MEKENRLKTRIRIKPLPNTNRMETKRNILFNISALRSALFRIAGKCSDSFFSPEKTTRKKPVSNDIKISSSVILVLKTEKNFVSKKEEYMAKTGITSLKSKNR